MEQWWHKQLLIDQAEFNKQIYPPYFNPVTMHVFFISLATATR